MTYFMVVSQADVPLYELELVAPAKARRSLRPARPRRPVTHAACAPPRGAQKDDSTHLHQFILHAALDMVEERVWDTSSMYLKASARSVRAASRVLRRRRAPLSAQRACAPR
jgi:hypothetical protein